MSRNGDIGKHAATRFAQGASAYGAAPADEFPLESQASAAGMQGSWSGVATSKAQGPTARRSVLPNVIIALVFLLGLCILLYPTVSNMYNQWRNNQLVSQYDTAVSQLSSTDYSAAKEAARAYNAALSPAFSDAFSGEGLDASDEYWQLLNVAGNGVMGYIEIPKISVLLPIYHGTGDAALQTGVGHLYGTSLPVGGVGTHCVLSGHRGLPSALLFTDLDQLAEGDRFALHVLGDTLAYEVDQISVVDPTDVSSLVPQVDGDYVTLVTCTPYGVNTQRLLVRAHRVDSLGDAGSVSLGDQLQRSFGWWREVILACIAAAALVVVVVARRKRRMYERRRDGYETRR